MTRHPLSVRHIRQIVRRPRSLKQRMTAFWAVTWRPGMRHASFCGNLFRPLGGATMMVQASFSRAQDREGIALAGVAARLDGNRVEVHYDNLRLRHDFHLTPEIGARGSILDPGEDRLEGCGNYSWVKLALDVDRARMRAARERCLLTAIPKLPEIFFGYGSRKQVEEAQNADSLSVATPHDFDEATKPCQCAARSGTLELGSSPSQSAALRFAWEAELVPPSDPCNNTGLWLLPHRLTSSLREVIRAFEYFGDLVGCEIPNPARRLAAKPVPNPAISVAQEVGIDLAGDLATLTQTPAGSPEYQAIEQRVVSLLPAYRNRLQAAEALSDDDMLHALCAYETPVVVEPALADFSEAEQLAKMRSLLSPEQNECCPDEAILQAVYQPNQSLHLPGQCQVQVLWRNADLPLTESLRFSSDELRRDRITTELWQPRGEFDQRRRGL